MAGMIGNTPPHQDGSPASQYRELAPPSSLGLAQHPSGRVRQLSRMMGLSRRQLQRRFSTAVGYGPKTFQRILRLQHVLALARKTQICDGKLSLLALETGYADQAHMTREIQRLTGQRPTALLSKVDTTLGMSDLFKTAPD
jgi:AraC-like DNA-binding protein